MYTLGDKSAVPIMSEGIFCANGLQTSPADFRDEVAEVGKDLGM